ncbi:hypothetical protein MCOR14_012109 [Pyricularia oryzae]|nr:hypothetical protein MCOR14_012109 [Pyricularia oryzae]
MALVDTRKRSFEELCSQLRRLMAIESKPQSSGQYLVDRRYQTTARNEQPRYRERSRSSTPARFNTKTQDNRVRKKGGCYICKKEDCRSWKHSREEQRAEKERWKREQRKRGQSGRGYRTYVQNIEGPEEDQFSSDSELSEAESDGSYYEESPATSHYMTKQGAELLADEAFLHRLPKVREHRTEQLPAPYEHSAQPPKVREHRTEPLPVAFEYGTGLPKVREHSSVRSTLQRDSGSSLL